MDDRELRQVMWAHSARDRAPIETWEDAECACGARDFALHVDAEAGAALTLCGACGAERTIGDGGDPEPYECPCGSPLVEVTVGASPRRRYVGGRCPACGASAVWAVA